MCDVCYVMCEGGGVSHSLWVFVLICSTISRAVWAAGSMWRVLPSTGRGRDGGRDGGREGEGGREGGGREGEGGREGGGGGGRRTDG